MFTIFKGPFHALCLGKNIFVHAKLKQEFKKSGIDYFIKVKMPSGAEN